MIIQTFCFAGVKNKHSWTIHQKTGVVHDLYGLYSVLLIFDEMLSSWRQVSRATPLCYSLTLNAAGVTRIIGAICIFSGFPAKTHLFV